MKAKYNTQFIVQASIIAALYAALTLALQPISFGPIQMRISEALCILLAFTPAAVPGLFVGCLLANIFAAATGVTIALDVILGSLTTLIAAYLGYRLRKHVFLIPLPSVLLNAIVIGAMLHYLYAEFASIFFSMLYVGIGQFLACYLIGMPLYYALHKANVFVRLSSIIEISRK